MRGHGDRQVVQRLEGGEIVVAQVLERGRHRRQFEMRIGGGAAVAGNMLHHRQQPARHQSFCGGAAEGRDDLRLLAVGALADHVAGALHRHVQHRQAVGADAIAGEVHGMQARQQPGGTQPCLLVVAIERAKCCASGIVRRQRRTQTLHPPTLLIDEDGRVPAHAVAQMRDQIVELLGFGDVAREQDEAPRHLASVERDLLAGE